MRSNLRRDRSNVRNGREEGRDGPRAMRDSRAVCVHDLAWCKLLLSCEVGPCRRITKHGRT